MYYLYIDNFRGFKDTCVPISDVNFLVGENSTGKTSIMSLLKLFAGPRLLMGRGFGHEHIDFGHFSDMVSAHSDDQSYFRIGFVSEHQEKKKGANGKSVMGSLFTFVEEDGLPRLHKCTFCRAGEKLTLKPGHYLSYKSAKCTPAATALDLISTLRSEWIAEHGGPDHGYSRLNVAGSGEIPIFVALSLIGQPKESVARQQRTGEIVFRQPEIAFIPPDLTWLAPIRTKPKRTYDELALVFSPEGQHTPYLIRRFLRSKSDAAKFRRFIDEVGKASGLFQEVKIRNFGRGATARFELDIVLDDKAFNVLNVGYGVSQSLPVIVEVLARERGTSFAIQQPEIHLHPRAQAALGDLLFQMAVLDQKSFIIETHSDFMIDRFRLNYRRERAQKPESQILFFQRQDKHNVVTPISIGSSGELAADQPDAYRQFFVKEQMSLLGL